MTNIIKLYNDRKYNSVYDNIIRNPKKYISNKFLYVRAMTEFKLGYFHDSYISFQKLLNKHAKYNYLQKYSNQCIKKIFKSSNTYKTNYNEEYKKMPNNFKWIIPAKLASMDKYNESLLNFFQIDNIISNVETINIDVIDKIINQINDNKITVIISDDKKIINTITICYALITNNDYPQLNIQEVCKKFNIQCVDQDFVKSYYDILWDRYCH